MEEKPSPKTIPQQAQEKQVNTKKENNSLQYLEILDHLITIIITTTGKLAPKQIEQFLAKMKTDGLLGSSVISVYYFFKIEKAATVQTTMKALNLTETSTYRSIRILQKHNFITIYGKIKSAASGGPRCKIYGVPEATPEDIIKAKQKQTKRITPGYQIATNIYQFILDDYLPRKDVKEISTRTIAQLMTLHFNTGGYNKRGLIEIVSQRLHEKGIKVWR